MDAGELCSEARRRTGLDDLGGESFRDGLEVLVDSLDREARLSEVGGFAMREMLVGLLVNRLEITDWYGRHPEIDDEEIVAPLFGLGLPRTASTQLSFLLAQDPATRSLRWWESDRCCPPPERATEHTDPRIAECEARLALQDQVAPEIKMMVPVSATGPFECLNLLAMEFRGQGFEGYANVSTYGAWHPACDMEPAYRWHQHVLKLLQWRCPPKRWSLKTPTHLFGLDALDSVYPDARFVMTHRDPAQVLPSVCSLIRASVGIFTDDPDPAYIGWRCLDLWVLAMERLVEFRDRVGDDRFCDVAFAELQADPIPPVRRLYERLGWDLTPDVEARMRAWQADNARDRHGNHRPDPADFGLDLDEVRERFAFYSERFS